MGEEYNGEGTDQARSPDEVFDAIRDLTGINKHNMYDLTPYDPHFNSLHKANAKIMPSSPIFNYFNIGWKNPKDMMDVISHKYINEGQSFAGVVLRSCATSRYFEKSCLAFSDIHDYPATTFGDFRSDLQKSLCIVIMAQPEWKDFFVGRLKARELGKFTVPPEICDRSEEQRLRVEEVITLKHLGWTNLDIRDKVKMGIHEVGIVVNRHKERHGDDVFTRPSDKKEKTLKLG